MLIDLGEEVPIWEGAYLWEEYFEEAQIRDVLDAITIATEACRNSNFVKVVANIFLEENVGYRIDENGLVHFAVDSEYERSSRSIIRGLDDARYANVLSAFKRVQVELDKEPPDGKLAIRAAFDSVEALFKLTFVRPPRLGAREIDQYLVPMLEGRGVSPTEARATKQLVTSLKAWVEACHFYRHEQGDEEPQPPTLDLAIALVASGSSFLRWLVSLDSQQQT